MQLSCFLLKVVSRHSNSVLFDLAGPSCRAFAGDLLPAQGKSPLPVEQAPKRRHVVVLHGDALAKPRPERPRDAVALEPVPRTVRQRFYLAVILPVLAPIVRETLQTLTFAIQAELIF